MSVRLLANVGGEEPLSAKPPPAVACVARLFCLLFAADSEPLDATSRAPEWPDALGPAPTDAAFPWLAADTGVFAWLNTQEAARAATDAGLPLLGPAPEVVRRVHDKAFALEVCRAEDLEAPSLRGLVTAFSPAEISDADAVLDAIRERVGGWPDWTRGRFTLKPRIGGSGRGRVGGSLEREDGEALRRALPRLARQGGALLEPWLEREADLSAQFYIAREGSVTLLATFEQQISRAGVYRGHRGRLDHRLRISSGSPHDAALLESASALARAARHAGFHGPCSVDAFVFRGARGSELRPLVELNARFTTGTVLAGLLRRARPVIEAHVPAPPGQLRRFSFALASPPEGWPTCAEPDRWVMRLGDADGALQPALVVERLRESPT